MSILLWGLLPVAQAETSLWTIYAKSAALTMVSTPVAVLGSEVLTHGSNHLVSGLLPPVLFGVAIPSSSAYFSSEWLLADAGQVRSFSGWRFSQTLLMGVGTYASGTALGWSSDSWQDMFMYSALNGLLLPLPNLLQKPESTVSYNLHFQPSDQGVSFTGGLHAVF